MVMLTIDVVAIIVTNSKTLIGRSKGFFVSAILEKAWYNNLFVVE